ARCGEMSRVGRNPIRLPKGVEVKLVKAGLVEVKGPKGTLSVNVHPARGLQVEDGVATVTRGSDDRESRAQHGLARALIANAVVGVSEGYTRELEIHGVGFRCQMKGKNLELSLGFSQDRKSTRLNSSHVKISYAVFCLKKKKGSCTAIA